MPENQQHNRGFIPKHGGYRNLITYQKAEIIYDATISFTSRFLKKYDRTVDQMVQAARSGKQNIAEASMASATSKEMEIKLTNVARSSLEELKLDYEDYLRTHKYELWGKDHRLVARLRELNKIPNATYETFRKGIEHENPEICANVIIGLIKVVSHLLYNQIQSLEVAFIQQGGLRERMTKARIDYRNKEK
jgi:four helix bundle suffix protein